MALFSRGHVMRETHAADISIFNRDGNKDYSVRYMGTAALAFQGEGTVTLTFRARMVRSRR